MTQTDQQNVPKLRFPGFEGDWETHKLADGVELISGQHLATSEYSTIKGEVPYFTGPSDFVNSEALVSKWTNDSGKVARQGDVLITVKGSGVGELLYLRLEKAAMGRQLMAIRERDFDTATIFQLLVTRKQKFVALASGNMIPGLARSDILGETIHLPTLPEQRKIASFLGAVDTKIAQLTEKKRLLEDYKKGCMQQLFSQKIRFKDDDGKDFPDWEEKRLGDVLGYEQPTKYLVASSEYSDGHKTPVLTAGKTFVLGYTDETEGVFSNLPTIIFDDFTTAFKFVDFPFKAKSSAMKMLTIKHDVDDIRFVHAAMMQIRFQVGEHKRYWIAEYQKEKIPYPQPEEQRKIADFLSALDRKIDLVGQELTHARAFKQGLLQQMFV